MAEHSTTPQLPQELVSHVLRHVDMQQRLGSCSLVCRAWRAAAAAATSTVILNLSTSCSNSSSKSNSLGQWLVAHGAGVTHIDICEEPLPTGVTIQLPYTTLKQLQQLYVRNCGLEQQAGSTSNSASTVQQQHEQQQPQAAYAHHPYGNSSNAGPSLACLTSLTSLTLDNVTWGLADGLAGLSALTGLQQLLLGPIRQPLYNHQLQDAVQLQQEALLNHYDWEEQLWRHVSNGLQRLSQLTQLELCGCLRPGVAPGLFQNMQQLKELILARTRVMCPATLQDLPASLTKLELQWWADSQLSSSTVPSLVQLTAMQHLSTYAQILRVGCTQVLSAA
jgi:hypothetical protein